jgi:hypothetical protein
MQVSQAVILQHFDSFPSWLRAMLIYASSLWLLVVMGISILKLLQQPAVRAGLHGVPPVIKLIGATMRELLKDPYPYPMIRRVLDYGTVAAFYALSSILFIDFIVLLSLLATTPRQLSWGQQVAVLCFSVVCALVGAVLKAEAGRCRFKLAKHS